MNADQIIETAIQGHASTRDAIRWAIQQEREACAKVVEEAPCECCWPEGSMLITEELADAIRARGNE